VTVPVAAVDIGTNSTNLLVVGAGGEELERVVTVTRLGQGVDKSRRLAPEAIERTLARLAHYRSVIDGHGVGATRAVATSACRDAENREEFFDAAEAVLGVRPELISGDEEGTLAFAGAVSGLAGVRPPHVVVDIGGGSTELMIGGDTLEQVRSLDVGSVRLTEALLHGDPPRPEELSNAIALVSDHLDDVIREVPGLMDTSGLVGIAGTITTIAAVEIGLPTFDPTVVHGYTLTKAAAEEVFRTLASEPLADRLHNPGLPPERADVIVGGCCVLVAVMRRLHATQLTVSVHSLLDGVADQLRRERR
jgi:exopolyphosphatase/guanosine-5'-triphosphate,3'-diphosphate pyrophosphatase